MSTNRDTRRKWLKRIGLGALTSALVGTQKKVHAMSSHLSEQASGEGIVMMWSHGMTMMLEAGWEGTKTDSRSALQYVYDLKTRFQMYKTAGYSEVFIKDITNLYHLRSGKIWGHFSVPTPSIYLGSKVRIRKILLNFETNSKDIFLTDVKIFDGRKVLAEYKDLKLYDNHIDRTFKINDSPEISSAIGISVKIKAIDARETDYIRFYSVGAEFIV